MDTKWKKLKTAVSFGAFFLGMTLLISNLVPLIGLFAVTDGKAFTGGMDYQENEEFRWYIGERLEELLGVATGRKEWNYYGTEAISGMRFYSGWDWSYAETTGTIVQEAQETSDIGIQTEAVDGSFSIENDAGFEKDAADKNLLYALVYQGKLVDTNMDAFADKTGKPWEGEDFYEAVSQSEYNFTLWFNREGDGKVQIVKDKVKENIYGNGIYTKDSRWFVPGYENFSVDAAANEAVVFMAAAKEPKLYVVGNYSEYGASWYSGRLYYMYQSQLKQMEQFEKNRAALLVSALMLALAVFLRKEKRFADQAAARFMGKIWLEGKILLLCVFAIYFFNWLVRGAQIGEISYLIYYNYNFGSIDFSSVSYYVDLFAEIGRLLTVLFWAVYLMVLDVRTNKGQQKKPILGNMRAKDLAYPIQKRLVKRYRLAFLGGILAIILCGLLILTVFSMNGYYFLDLGEYLDSHLGYPWDDAVKVVVLVAAVLLFGCGAANVAYVKKNRRMAEDIGALIGQINKVKTGNLAEPLSLPKDTDLGQAAESLNEIQHGLEEALREQMHSERMKVELVTNVSHDIKTPLTSIISYVELLKQEEGLPEHVAEFIQILSEKSERLRNIVQDVFEVSKATSGQLSMKMEKLDLGKLLRQTLADMDDQIRASALTMKVSIPEEPVLIRADGQRLYRVFQNLIQNALKYSLQGSRVFLTLTDKDVQAIVCIKNISGVELDNTTDLTERFIRGDASRTDGGSGLGLSIAKSFTQACGGNLSVEVDADLFTVMVTFPLWKG